MRRAVPDVNMLQKRIEHAGAALEAVRDLNQMLAMPAEFQSSVKGNRRPIHEHFGRSLFPIVPKFDTGFGAVTIQQLAKALIDKEQVEANLRQFYRFAPADGWLSKRDMTYQDPRVVHDTLIRFMLYDYACLENFRMPYKRLLAEVGKRTPGAFFKIVKVDKTFLAGSYGASVIIMKQHEGDWEFFEKLGDAVRQKPVDEPEYLFKAKLICAYLWDTELAGVSFPKLVGALREGGALGRGVDPRSFAKMLNRHGLKRTQYNRK